jgi:hypothetical protein
MGFPVYEAERGMSNCLTEEIQNLDEEFIRGTYASNLILRYVSQDSQAKTS